MPFCVLAATLWVSLVLSDASEVRKGLQFASPEGPRQALAVLDVGHGDALLPSTDDPEETPVGALRSKAAIQPRRARRSSHTRRGYENPTLAPRRTPKLERAPPVLDD